ncbi:MAG: bifunctional diaminohydroxyphosphoribosylaminopyrimidine deaminase/5-amino-6-(5-phosphoribosylamino)uracil reductase RibD [Candidatus Berkiella sp.]
MSNELDITYMRQAIALANQGQFSARPNPMVGCVIVADGQVVGQGSHLQCGQAHAEINALAQAKEKAKGATAYVTLEPCAHTGKTGPCVDALIEAGIQKVVIATLDPNPLVKGKGIEKLQLAGIEVVTFVLAEQARELNLGFFSRMQRQKPYVRVKIGMSLDGKTAMQNGQSQWITSEESRTDVQQWRAKSGAIVTTLTTLVADNCRLTLRDIEGIDEIKAPLRVVIDTQLQSPVTSQLFSLPGKVVVVVSDKVPNSTINEWLDKVPSDEVECIGLPLKDQHIDFSVLLDWLAEYEVNDLLVEAGAEFVGGLLQNALVDELLVYVAPKILGSNARGMADLPMIQQLEEHLKGKYLAVERIGPDLRLRVALSDFARVHHDHS